MSLIERPVRSPMPIIGYKQYKGRFSAFILIALLFVAQEQSIARKGEPSVSRYGIGFGVENYSFGYNLNTTFRYSLKEWPLVFYGGINFHLNNNRTGKLDGLDQEGDRAFRIHDDRWFARNFSQRFGFKVGFERYIKLNRDNYELFWFYDFQKNTLAQQSFDVTFVAPDNIHGNDTFVGQGYIRDNNDLLRNNVGLGISLNLHQQLYLKAMAGAGITIMRGINSWDYGYLLSLQAHYTFQRRKKQNK